MPPRLGGDRIVATELGGDEVMGPFWRACRFGVGVWWAIGSDGFRRRALSLPRRNMLAKLRHSIRTNCGRREALQAPLAVDGTTAGDTAASVTVIPILNATNTWAVNYSRRNIRSSPGIGLSAA